MDIKQSQTSKNPVQLTSAKLISLNLKLNQQLEVKVIQVKKELNLFSLQLPESHKSIEVQSNLPLQLKPGQILKLLVSQLLPTPEFKISHNSSNNTPDSSRQLTEHLLKNIILKQIMPLKTNVLIKESPLLQDIEQQKVINTLKQILPKQQPPEALLNQIIITLDKINKNRTVSRSLKQLVKEITASLPQTDSLGKASQLKSLIQNSGLFMEAKLIQGIIKNHSGIQQDFKAKLLKFQQALKQDLIIKQQTKSNAEDFKLLKEILQKTENSLSRIILNQLTSLPKDDGAKQVWIIDLPFLDKEIAQSVKIAIDRENQPSNDNDNDNWSVTITVTPPELATIYCKVSCFDNAINTIFWSENLQTIRQINQHLDLLQSQFKKAGLRPGHMAAHTSHAIKQSQTQPATQNLLDQQA